MPSPVISKQPDLVGRAEAVLEGAHEAQRGLPVALELAHHVDEVLEQAWTRDRAVLRDVADEQHRQLAFLRDADERGGDLAHLARLPGQPVGERARHGLHRVDDEQLGATSSTWPRIVARSVSAAR